MRSVTAGAWERVAREELERGADPFRVCNDAAHVRWLRASGAKWEGAMVVKTDLFDEAVSPAGGPGGWLRQRGARVFGVDISPRVTREAVRRGRVDGAAVGDVRALPYAPEWADVVVSNSTLDHFGDAGEIERAIGEIRRILKPGGRLLVTLDNPRNPVMLIRSWAPGFWRKAGVAAYPGGVTLNAKQLRRLLERQGFEIEAETALLHHPRVAGAALLRCWPGGRGGKRLVRVLLAFEKMAAWPTRYLTGHYVAVEAVKAD